MNELVFKDNQHEANLVSNQNECMYNGNITVMTTKTSRHTQTKKLKNIKACRQDCKYNKMYIM